MFPNRRRVTLRLMWKWVWVGFVMACRGTTGSPDVDALGQIDVGGEPRVDVLVTDMFRTGAPDSTAIVVFADDTGTIIQHGPVDALGHAHAALAGGTVTVLQVATDPQAPNNVFDAITTIHGVKSLDQLEVGSERDPLLETGGTHLMTASYTLPAATATLGFVTSCGTGGTDFPIPPTGPATFTFYDSCLAPTFDLYAVHDSTAGQRRFVWQPDVPYVEDDAFVIEDAWQPMVQSTITFTNVPTNQPRIGATESIYIGATPIEIDRPSEELPAAGTHVLPILVAPGAGRVTTLSAGLGTGVFQRSEGITVVTHGSPENLTIDMTALPVPTVTGAPMQTANTTTWTETTVGSPDLRMVTWSGSWQDSTKHHQASWVSIENPADASFTTTFGGLPDDYAADDPTKVQAVLDGATVRYSDYDHLDGYDAARSASAFSDGGSRFLGVDHRVHVSISSCLSSHGPC